jgi:hypothetical protein
MNINLFSPHNGQKYIIDNFADSKHKFGVVATGRQFGKSLLAQNMMRLKKRLRKCLTK